MGLYRIKIGICFHLPGVKPWIWGHSVMVTVGRQPSTGLDRLGWVLRVSLPYIFLSLLSPLTLIQNLASGGFVYLYYGL